MNHEQIELPNTMDADVWVKAFNEYLYKLGGNELEEEILHPWFAGALMTGFSRFCDTPYMEELLRHVAPRQEIKEVLNVKYQAKPGCSS